MIQNLTSLGLEEHKKFISKGSRIKINDLSFKKPGNGIQTKYYKKIINRVAKTNIKEDELIKWEKIKKK